MKKSFIAFFIVFTLSSVNVHAKTVQDAVKRYWQGYCYKEQSVLDLITKDYTMTAANGKKHSYKDVASAIRNHHTLIEAVKKDDFATTYNIFTASLAQSGVKIKTTDPSQISQKDKEQFMTMMKHLTTGLPDKMQIRKNESLRIVNIRESKGEIFVDLSFRTGNSEHKAKLLLMKSGKVYPVREHREY